MKNHFTLHTLVVLLCLLFQLHSKSQINFTIALPACAGSTQTLILVSGSVSVLSNTWTSLPTGAVFSAPNASVTTVNFPSAGTFTIAVGALTSAGLAFFTNTISIIALPSLTLSQSNSTTCIASNSPKFSKPVHLSALGATNYTWYPLQSPPMVPGIPGSTDVRPSVSSCFTVVGNTSGCESSASICVTVVPQFSIQVNPNPAVRCLPDSLKLSIVNIQNTAVGPTSAFTYSWTEASTSTLITMNSYFTPSVLVFPTSANTYTAEMRDSRDCVSLPVTVNVSVQNCVGLESNLVHSNEIWVYPNPTHGLFQIKWDQQGTITILNALGQKIFASKHEFQQSEIDLSAFTAGIYYLTFVSEEKHFVRKLIKE